MSRSNGKPSNRHQELWGSGSNLDQLSSVFKRIKPQQRFSIARKDDALWWLLSFLERPLNCQKHTFYPSHVVSRALPDSRWSSGACVHHAPIFATTLNGHLCKRGFNLRLVIHPVSALEKEGGYAPIANTCSALGSLPSSSFTNPEDSGILKDGPREPIRDTELHSFVSATYKVFLRVYAKPLIGASAIVLRLYKSLRRPWGSFFWSQLYSTSMTVACQVDFMR
eukprot:5925388-Pyramimonas_sp.AAC.1